MPGCRDPVRLPGPLQEMAFFEYEEPLMGPRFFPTYKKMVSRGKTNYRSLVRWLWTAGAWGL